MLPQDCLLCGGHAGARAVCIACERDLPRLPEARCPVCAEASPSGAICGACMKSPPHFDATAAAFRYAFPADRLVHALKFGRRLATAEFLAEAMLAAGAPAGEILVPMPLSNERLRERGFNQSAEIARPLARALGLPLLLDGCGRRRHTAAQASLPWKARRANVRHAFECSFDLAGRAVIVVDDVMTTGATADEFARTLKAHGAARATLWVAARTLKD